jgi:uncharacterized protein (TIGR03437 family)
MRTFLLCSLLTSLVFVRQSEAQPTIATGGIVNATGYQATLAPDTVFVIFGSGMGPAALAAGTASPSYPASLSGTSIGFTPAAGGSAIPATIVYTSAGQVAGLLPSSIAPGTYAVRVTYNGQPSAPQNVTVAARSYGIASANSSGSGLAQSTIGNVNGGLSLTRFTTGSVGFNGFNYTLTPAHPGDTLVLWGTGGGADAANDTGGTSGDQTAAGNFMVNIGGVSIKPLYAGASSGYPGLWQVNFVLPQDIAPDCFATAQVSAGGQVGNSVTIPIAAPGQAACSDSTLSASSLAKLDSGGSIVVGAFAVAKITTAATNTSQETASGAVFKFTSAEWIISHSGPLFGPCRVYDRSYPAGGQDPGIASASLDAGSRIPLTGPNVAAGFALGTTQVSYGPVYTGALTTGTLVNGSYTLAAPGGTQVGPFNATTTFPSSFTLTNLSSINSIDRTQPLVLNWTGSGFDQVAIVISTTVATAALRHLTTITCTVPAATGGYTVPSGALAYLSQVAASGASSGTLSVQGTNQPTFAASVSGGGQFDFASFAGNLGVSKNVAVQ